MRGKGVNIVCGSTQNRITPAYAGKRRSSVSLMTNMRDHPRLCGEKEWSSSADQTAAGSPPPMRGKALH